MGCTAGAALLLVFAAVFVAVILKHSRLRGTSHLVIFIGGSVGAGLLLLALVAELVSVIVKRRLLRGKQQSWKNKYIAIYGRLLQPQQNGQESPADCQPSLPNETDGLLEEQQEQGTSNENQTAETENQDKNKEENL